MINKCHQYKKRVKSVKEGIFLLKKNNELRKGGYLKSFYKDIMKVAFFVCILFLLFFIIHTKKDIFFLVLYGLVNNYLCSFIGVIFDCLMQI